MLYVYIGGIQKTKEKFTSNSNYNLIDGDNMIVFQGVGLPDSYPDPSLPDRMDPSNPSVDGNIDGQRSKFLFAYNECKPECCATSGGYSCDGGCPCMTNEQLGYSHSRGNNSKLTLCSKN